MIQSVIKEKHLLTQVPILTILGLILTLATMACYILGAFSPFIEVSKFWIFTNEVSLYRSIVVLFQTHNDFLGAVIVLFSVLIPLVKFALLLGMPLFCKPSLGRRILFRAESLGKWAMVDVFVVAIIVVSLKLGMIVSVQVHMGAVYFSISIVMTMFLVRYFHWLTKKAILKAESIENAASTKPAQGDKIVLDFK